MRVRPDRGQGKEFATANATVVDTAVTLLQGRPRGSTEQTLLGRYRLIERLGEGGFGVVWAAHDGLLDREVAIKRIALPSQEDRDRARREALASARLSHPAIVGLYEAGSDDDAFYLISELVEGDTLAQLIAADELDDEETLEIGIALAEALEHAHARGVIHRDVKPQNVLVPGDLAERTPGQRGAPPVAAKLADFGGARMAGEDALTRTGDVLGTLAYMAPEQSEGQEAGAPADLYSLALVLYEALCGVNPVRGHTPAATAKRIGSPIESLERRRRDLPRDLTYALDVALHPDPARRGTLAELREALHDALEGGLKHRGFVTPTRLAQSRPVELPRLVWIGCVLALAVWQGAAARPGVALLLLAAGAPLLLLPPRSGPGWLAGVLAPLLGLAGLAAAFPAVAGQRARWSARAGLAALGFWWLVLCESLVDRRLWLGPSAKLPPRQAWESSLGSAANHVVVATFTLQLLVGMLVWAVAAVILPWVVRGRNAALDVLGAVAWTVALLLAMPMLEQAVMAHGGEQTPRGLVLGATLGCAVAICARALRGPV